MTDSRIIWPSEDTFVASESRKTVANINIPDWIVGVSHDEENTFAGELPYIKDNCRFIAAANPQTILALTSALREAYFVLAAITEEPWSFDPTIKSSDLAMKALASIDKIMGEIG